MDENQILLVDETAYSTNYTKKFADRKQFKSKDIKKIHAFIPGTIREVFVKNGDTVKKGTSLCILEAMKMKNLVLAPLDGTIKIIHVKVGSVVSNKQLIIEFE